MVIQDILDFQSLVRIYGPITEDQAWAICYNLIKSLKRQKLNFRSKHSNTCCDWKNCKIESLEDILLHKDGFVQLKKAANDAANNTTLSNTTNLITANNSSRTSEQEFTILHHEDDEDEEEEVVRHELDDDDEFEDNPDKDDDEDGEELQEEDDDDEDDDEDELDEEREFVASLGIALFRALDYGIADDEERKLSMAMEYLIYQSQSKLSVAEILDLCTKRLSNNHEAISHLTSASATSNSQLSSSSQQAHKQITNNNNKNINNNITNTTRTSKSMVTNQAPKQHQIVNTDHYYRDVCKSLLKDTIELSIFLDKIYTASMVLRDTINLDDCLHDKHQSQLRDQFEGVEFAGPSLVRFRLNDWARLWMQVMKELRQYQLQ